MALSWLCSAGTTILSCLGGTWLETGSLVVFWESIAEAITQVDSAPLPVEDRVLGYQSPVRSILLIACSKCRIFLGVKGRLSFVFPFSKILLPSEIATSDCFTKMCLGIRIHLVIGVGEVGAESILEITCSSVREEGRKLWIGKDLLPISDAMLVAPIDECLRFFGGPPVLLTALSFGCFAT